ncbi:MAG: hypothetical protein ACD_46C00262G0012 [uncultured bacterium]|nr:MAG: hypothetical protein ACD_46C00262G0012 [uncultured bacterium]
MTTIRFRKLIHTAKYVIRAITLLPFMPIVLLIRLISPICEIHITPIFTSRIGHFALDTELYICLKSANKQTNNRIIEFFCYQCNSEICNPQLNKMWRRVIPLLYGINMIYLANYHLTKILRLNTTSLLSISEKLKSDAIIKSKLNISQTRLYFTASEHRRGKHFIQKFLKNSEKGFVCIHSRNPTYLKNSFPNDNFSYHDYRDSDIDHFVKTAENLATLEYTVFRMGSVRDKAVCSSHQSIIDYVNQYHDPFLDIYLPSNCSFYIGDTSGLSTIPTLFKRPVAITNAIPLNEFSFLLLKNIIFIPKLFWSETQNRLLTIREMMTEPFLRMHRMEMFQINKIRVINNTPDEILDLSQEMHLRHMNAWEESHEDRERQQAFMSHLSAAKYYFPGHIFAKVGSSFLKKYETLL